MNLGLAERVQGVVGRLGEGGPRGQGFLGREAGLLLGGCVHLSGGWGASQAARLSKELGLVL